MRYGEPPVVIGRMNTNCQEMMFYQYLPIKLNRHLAQIRIQPRLYPFSGMVNAAAADFIDTFGHERYEESYMYLTAKHLYVSPQVLMNRPGYHTDGFMTDDINYIWSNVYPTIFNVGEFNLSQDDEISMREMEEQALPENEVTYGENTLLRLSPYNVHKVAPVIDGRMRTFVKVSFSKDKYDLVGNAHNYLLEYDWKMKDRKNSRNIPQSKM